jgi:hypothetical protein
VGVAKLEQKACRFQLAVANEIVLKLDQAQEKRALSPDELQLRRDLKGKSLGLASLALAHIARQRSRITYLSEGDANTRFFHLQACHRRHLNNIESLQVHGASVVQEEETAEALFSFYNNLLGTPVPPNRFLNFQELGIPSLDLSTLEDMFTEVEIWQAITQLPSDKAPGPDRFTGLFHKVA